MPAAPLPFAAALVTGAGLAFAVVVLSSGSVGPGGIGWAMAAGAFACASGLVLGTAGRALPAGALGMVAVASLVAAGAASAGDDGRRAEFPARASLVPPPPPPPAATPRVRAVTPRERCDGRTRRFAVTWRLAGRTATALSARALPGAGC